MDEKVVIRGLDMDGHGFAIAIYRDGAAQPSYVSEILGAGDCALVLVRLADKLKLMGCRYQVQVCERLADVARHTAVSMN